MCYENSLFGLRITINYYLYNIWILRFINWNVRMTKLAFELESVALSTKTFGGKRMPSLSRTHRFITRSSVLSIGRLPNDSYSRQQQRFRRSNTRELLQKDDVRCSYEQAQCVVKSVFSVRLQTNEHEILSIAENEYQKLRFPTPPFSCPSHVYIFTSRIWTCPYETSNVIKVYILKIMWYKEFVRKKTLS